MIRHIVMWKLKDHAEGASRADNLVKVKALLESVKDCVPGIVEFEVGVATPGMEATFDVVLNSLFESQDTLDAYQGHPTHVAIKPFMSAVRASRECMDYVVSKAR